MIVDASRCRSVPPGMALGLRTLRQGYRACPMLRPWTRVRSLGPSAEDDMYSWAEQLAARRRKYEAMGYQTQFRMNYNGSAQSEVVTGLVAGAQLVRGDGDGHRGGWDSWAARRGGLWRRQEWVERRGPLR